MANRSGDVIKLAVVGHGVIGRRHAEQAREHPEFELVAIIDPAVSDANFRDIADVDVAVDAVIISSPSSLHADNAIVAAERGWHMIVEKPVAHSLEAADAIIEAVERTGVKALVGHHRRHHASVVKLREMIEAGGVGRVISANLMWLTRKPDSYFDIDWRRGPDGSPVMMNLVHDIDLLRYMLGDVTEIVGVHGGHHRSGDDRNESGALALAFDSGATATIAFADSAASPWGFERGTAESPAIPATRRDMLFIAGTEGAVSFPSLTLWGGASDWTEMPIPTPHLVPDTVPFTAQLDHFADVINGTAQPRITIEEGRKTLAATLEAERIITAHRNR